MSPSDNPPPRALLNDTTRFAQLLIQTSERLNQRVAQMFDKTEGLKTVEVRILLSLAREQPRGVGDISRHTRLDKAWISRTVRSLRTRGFVRIEDGDSPHAKLVSLTPKGMACAQRIIPLLAEEWTLVARGIDVRLGAGMLEIVLGNLEGAGSNS